MIRKANRAMVRFRKIGILKAGSLRITIKKLSITFDWDFRGGTRWDVK